MLKALKSWWSSKDKAGKRYFFFILIATAVMVTYLLIHGSIAGADSTTPFAQGTQLNRPMVGGWDDVWPRIFGTLFYFCLLISIGTIVRFLLFVCFLTANNKVTTVVKLISSTIKYACA